MKGFIQRLALLIHWVGFLFGVSFGALFIYLDRIDNSSVGDVAVFIGLGSYIAAHASGWIVSFLLTGNKSIWPWKSND